MCNLTKFGLHLHSAINLDFMFLNCCFNSVFFLLQVGVIELSFDMPVIILNGSYQMILSKK